MDNLELQVQGGKKLKTRAIAQFVARFSVSLAPAAIGLCPSPCLPVPSIFFDQD
jgi:hypothetical protein